MSKLRLGAIAEDRPVKVTVELPGAVLRDLTDYARVHAGANGLSEPLPAERLIAPMIEHFMSGDREFGKLRRQR
ncbi:DUF2274 domain-containing protein [Sphingopyxis sp. SCN 67-31]|uniref:DUF2274 domain-containing protein n=1 Tax=Sphingopyxis sp. SCN 67-31 TaxID=1660142 RepID=UPI00086AF754|nr:DUF2274 domain-containing protein [Sphingopyxis sp. SCN 67-31]ODU34657.1 MAG: hypothetical protein ABS88_01675 [Sphingopyxis sp. SCN 67-31]